MGCHLSLNLKAFVAEGGNGPGGATKQSLEDPRFAFAETFRMPGKLINPDGDFQPLGCGHGMLPVGAAGEGHVF